MITLVGRFRNIRRRAFVVTVLCAVSLQLRADSDVERSLTDKYKGKVLRLQKPFAGDHLVFSSDGSLLRGGDPGTWALDGNVVITKMKADEDKLEIEARRALLDWDFDHKQFQPLPARPVRITVIFPSAGLAPTDVERALGLLFSGDTGDEDIPSYWKAAMEHSFSKGKRSNEPSTASQMGTLDGQPVYSFGSKGEVTFPSAIRQPDPPYTPEARRAKISGTVFVVIIVDAQGDVRDAIETSKPLGYGLDQLAILTVQQWKFKPARKNGAPVAVQIGVEVTFRLLG